MRTASSDVDSCCRLTAGIEGSFGTLHYAIVALNAAHSSARGNPNPQLHRPSALDLLSRGFKPVRSADLEDIVLKAQPANGSVRCRVSTEGLVQLLVDNDLVWSRQFDPKDEDHALWLKAARTRDVTVLSGSLSAKNVQDSDSSANMEPLVMAKVPAEWTR